MLEVVLVGELKAGTGQAEFFPWDYCSLFLDLCWLGANDFSHLKCAIIIQEKACLEE